MAEEKAFNQTDEKPVFVWKASEFASYQKSPGWFIMIVFIALVLIGIFVWMKNWTAAGLVFASALALFSVSRTAPKKVSCSLYHSGVVIDQKAYHFSDLKSFWLLAGEHPSIRFTKAGRFTTPVNMPIADEDPEQIRLFLSKYLPQETDKGEDIADSISRWIRF